MWSVADSSSAETPKQILVVEDNIDVFEVLQICLNARWPDASILNAPAGELGLQMARAGKPDAIILDIGLPDIDGFEVCSRIRGFSDAPIVILTVRDSEQDIIRGLELGADDYMIKPFQPQELLARVGSVLRRSQTTHLRDEEVNLRQGELVIKFKKGEIFANSEPIRLTATEHEVFFNLISNEGRMVARQTLSDNISGEEYRDSPFLLAPHISRLKETLQGYPQTQNLSLQEGVGGYSLTLMNRRIG